MKQLLLSFLTITIPIFFSLDGHSQENDSIKLLETSIQSILKRPVKGLRSIEIVSASKKAEKIFDAPVAISTISREEIQQAGALSVMEALRLLPGVLVRETSSGNYDINVRGFNNVPPSSDLYTADNSNTLVMIDNRPIYNYFSGGTFWETLPIDIHDIERIELVRGASSALYGSNAVTGVIHFITRKLSKEGFSGTGNVEYGNLGTFRASGSGGYAPNSKFQLLTSFNYTQRKRTSDLFYDFINRRYMDIVNDPKGLPNYQTATVLRGLGDLLRKYPQPNISMDKYAFNTFLSYAPSSSVAFDVAAGLEDSYAIRPFSENTFTPLSTMLSRTQYLDLKSRIKDGTIQISHLAGTQQPGVDAIGAYHDFRIWDLQADYNITWKGFSIKPSIAYKNSLYDDTKYFNNQDLNQESGALNGRKVINIFSPSLRLDYTYKGLRLVAAALYSKFSVPEQGYWSYQFAGTYKINDKHLLRIVYAQANRGAFFTQVYADYRDSRRQLAPNIFSEALVKGNGDLRLLTSRSIELGYRFSLNDKFSTDIEFFQSDAKDFTSLILRIDTLIQNRAVLIRPTYTQTNIPLEVTQRGITLNLNYAVSTKFQTKVFLTFQQTNIRNFSPFVFDPRLNPVANYLTVSNINDYKGTPSVYGGFYMNYALSKFNINLNGYYFSNQELTHLSDGLLRRPPTIAAIPNKLLLNAKVSYRPIRQFLLYANARNILFQDSFEYVFTDPVGSVIAGGVQYDF